MKAKVFAVTDYFSNSIQGFRRLNNQLVNPLKAGLIGFMTILIIIYVFHIISFLTGSSQKFGVDSVDFLLAMTGFVLQTIGTLVKSFVK